jgi:hypothetical protein
MVDDNTNYFEGLPQLFFGIMGIGFKNGSIFCNEHNRYNFSFNLTNHFNNIM